MSGNNQLQCEYHDIPSGNEAPSDNDIPNNETSSNEPICLISLKKRYIQEVSNRRNRKNLIARCLTVFCLLFIFGLVIFLLTSFMVTYHFQSKTATEPKDSQNSKIDNNDNSKPALSPRGCPSDWMAFDRPQGRWCIKVFYRESHQIGAENLCKDQGATLTGLQDANERIQVANVARALNNQHLGGDSEVFLGGTRRTQCQHKADCAPNDTFEWTDGHTTGKNGFHWAPGEPNAQIKDGYGIQSCLEIFVSVSDTQRARWGSHHGDLDDVQCFTPLKMYACGKVAN